MLQMKWISFCAILSVLSQKRYGTNGVFHWEFCQILLNFSEINRIQIKIFFLHELLSRKYGLCRWTLLAIYFFNWTVKISFQKILIGIYLQWLKTGRTLNGNIKDSSFPKYYSANISLTIPLRKIDQKLDECSLKWPNHKIYELTIAKELLSSVDLGSPLPDQHFFDLCDLSENLAKSYPGTTPPLLRLMPSSYGESWSTHIVNQIYYCTNCSVGLNRHISSLKHNIPELPVPLLHTATSCLVHLTHHRELKQPLLSTLLSFLCLICDIFGFIGWID